MDTDKKELLAEKKALRAKILAVRRELKEAYRQKASQRMMDVFCALPDFKEPKVVMCYASMGDEVQIRPLIQRWLDMGVTVTMPRVISKGQMEAVTLPDLLTVAIFLLLLTYLSFGACPVGISFLPF